MGRTTQRSTYGCGNKTTVIKTKTRTGTRTKVRITSGVKPRKQRKT